MSVEPDVGDDHLVSDTGQRTWRNGAGSALLFRRDQADTERIGEFSRLFLRLRKGTRETEHQEQRRRQWKPARAPLTRQSRPPPPGLTG